MKLLLSLEENCYLFENYFKGLIAGDGNFFAYRDKNGSLHSTMSIYDERKQYIDCYANMLNHYGLCGTILKSANKNMYILRLNNNWDMLLLLLKHNLFQYAPKHKDRLIWTIKNHNRYRSLKYVLSLKDNFDITDINQITKRDYSYSANWIRKREKERMIKFVRASNGRRVWRLTPSGEDLKNLLKLI